MNRVIFSTDRRALPKMSVDRLWVMELRSWLPKEVQNASGSRLLGLRFLRWEHDLESVVFRSVAGDDGHRSRPIVGIGGVPFGGESADPAGHAIEGADRRRQRDPLELAAEHGQPLDGGDEVDPALARGDGVNLVEDDAAKPGEEAPAALRRQQDVEGFGGGDENLGWRALHPAAGALRGVAGPALDPDDGPAVAARIENRVAEFGQRFGEVAPDVVAQRLERRDIEDPGRAGLPLAGQQAVKGPEKGGEGLAAAGGCGEQDVLARRDPRPRLRSEHRWADRNVPRTTRRWRERRAAADRRAGRS